MLATLGDGSPPLAWPEMKDLETNLDRLLKARAEIDEELARHKTTLTVLFTDIVGSTAYFERHGDTAGLSMLHRHVEMATHAVTSHKGRVIKTIGDSVMAEFPRPELAVRTAVEIQQRQFQHNQHLSDHERVQIRTGVHAGLGFRHGNDVYGDVVNVAARITKRTGPSQILGSRLVREAIARDPNVQCNWLGRMSLEGRTEKEDVFEVIWTDAATYADLRQRVAAAVRRGDIASPGPQLDEFAAGDPLSPVPPGEPVPGPFPTPVPAALNARYDILGQIGRGGMGILYKARDRETGEVLALKVLDPEVAADQAGVERFKNELRLARKIVHKNVCRNFEFNRADGTAYITMEYVEGESLRQILNRLGALSLRKGLQMAQQVCAALHEAHSQGIVHRDLKPENVMIDREGNVKVMDFGLARSFGSGLAHSGVVVGTPAYMAPEQAEGNPVDHRADIYALGLIVYEMLTGAPAFSGDTPMAIALKQVRERPTPPRQIEPALPTPVETTILRCLEKDPARRFQSAQELATALQQATTPTPPPVAVTGTKAGEPAWRASLRQWGLVWLSAGFAVALIVAALATGKWRRAAPTEPPPQEQVQGGTQAQAPTQTEPQAQPPAPAPSQTGKATPGQSQPTKPRPAEPIRETTRPTRSDATQPAAAEQPGIYLRVYSFKQENPAKSLADELEDMGFRTRVEVKNRIFWRSYDVMVGPYKTPEAALAARQRLEAHGYKNIRPIRED
ncbi:MAG: protein kinase [Acidobacteria bacterium]|nr:protein kinase [Acidobacteriota bacterium]